ncbi:hypothetical protein ABBQ32_012573 [Trebouxia sp. C0010 RCD-2024]
MFRSLTGRVKEAWSRQRNVELCEMAAKDASRFWRLFKTPHSNACPVELSAQFAAFRALMGAEPQSPKQPRQQQPAVPAQDTGKSKKRKRIAGSRQEPGTAIWYNSALLISPAGYQTPLPICAWALPDVNLRDKRLLVSRLQAGDQ